MHDFLVWMHAVWLAIIPLVTGGGLMATVWFVFAAWLDRPVPYRLTLAIAFGTVLWACYAVYAPKQKEADDQRAKVARLSAEVTRLHAATLATSTPPPSEPKVSSPSLADVTHSEPTQRNAEVAEQSAPNDATSSIQGDWHGTYICSYHTGSLDWHVQHTRGSDVRVNEAYVAHLFGDHRGNVKYTGSWVGGTLNLRTEMLGGYEVEASISTDGQSLTGNYYNKPGCSTLELSR